MMQSRKKKRVNPRFMVLCLAAVCLTAAMGVWVWKVVSGGPPGAGIAQPDYVTRDFLTVNPYSRPQTELEKINGIVIHYVGNPDTSAKANRDYFESLKEGTEDIYASAHYIIGLDAEVVQCIPLSEWAYASNIRNEDTISIEVCHPDDTGEFSDVTYDRLVELTAWLCQTFDLKSKDVIRHYDVSGKECPKYYVENEEAWNAYLEDVDQALAKLSEKKDSKDGNH